MSFFLTFHSAPFVAHLDFMSSAFVWVVLDTDRPVGVILDFRSQTISIRSRHFVLNGKKHTLSGEYNNNSSGQTLCLVPLLRDKTSRAK